MRVIPPLVINPLMLTTSPIAEPDLAMGEVSWAAGTVFGLGDKVIVGAPSATVTISAAAPAVVTWAANGLPNGTPVILTTTGALPTGLTAGALYYVVNRAAGTFQLSATLDGPPITTSGTQSGTHTATGHVHRKYQSVATGNSGNPPAIDDESHWLDIGPTNRWAMFDLDQNTGTTKASPLTVVLAPGQRIDSIGLTGLVADTVTITVTVGGSTVYTYTTSLLDRLTVGWYSYFFGPFRYRKAVGLFDLPPYTNAVITITLTRATGMVACGGVVIGQGVYLGRTLHDAEREGLNFSKVDRDEYGTASLQPRRSVPQITATVRVKKTQVPTILALIDTLNAKVAFWSGIDDQESGYFPALTLVGFYTKLTINMDQPEEALVSLELQEV